MSAQVKNFNLMSGVKEKFRAEFGLFSNSDSLITGYKEIDNRFGFRKGDLVTIQGITSHGKTTFMVQLAYRFLSLEENLKVDPMCVFVSLHENSYKIKKKFLNIIGCENGEGVMFKPPVGGKSVLPKSLDFQKTIRFYNDVFGEKIRMKVLSPVDLEKLEEDVIEPLKEKFPNRTLVLFLDCFHYIGMEKEKDFWEKNKRTARRLRSLASEKNIVIFVSSQVNSQRLTVESRELLHSSTVVMDIFHHSDTVLDPKSLSSLRTSANLKRLYAKPVDGKYPCSISVFKARRATTFYLYKKFLFNGLFFVDQ